MSPLRVAANGNTSVIGSEGGSITTRDNLQVLYSGDRLGRVIVLDHNQNIIGRYELSIVGSNTEINYEVHVAPIEAGEPTTPVKRSLGIERY